MQDIQGDLMFSIGLFLAFLFLAFLLVLTITVTINDFEKKLKQFAIILNKRYDMERKINQKYPDEINPQAKDNNA